MEFQPFSKIARLSREMVITEKLDGTNAQICIRPRDNEDGTTNAMEFGIDTQVDLVSHGGTAHYLRAGSRNRWLRLGDDNFGFAAWVYQNAPALVKLGPGRHFGEWYGRGIQRGYGLDHKRFALFNVGRWFKYAPSLAGPPDHKEMCPDCCDVVPILYEGVFDTSHIESVMAGLYSYGSYAARGFMNPEGIIVYHKAANLMFKKTFDKDDQPKGRAA